RLYHCATRFGSEGHPDQVGAEAGAGGARLDQGEVDAAHGELGEDLQQGARVVHADERDDGRLVRAGRRGRGAGAVQDDEAGDGVGDVVDVVGEDGEPVA